MKVHDEKIIIPRRPRRTAADIVVKSPIVTQLLDNYIFNSVSFAPPVVIAPKPDEAVQQDRFAEHVSVCQTSYQVCTSLPIHGIVVEMPIRPLRKTGCPLIGSILSLIALQAPAR